MGKLHQHLAVEDSKATNFRNVMEEALSTYKNRGHLFNGRVVNQVSKVGEDHPLYHDYPDATHTQPCAETVMGKISWVFEHAKAYFDLTAQKDNANCVAKADLIIGGKTILKDVPAVTLLFIENKLKSIRNLLQASPTLDAAQVWKTHEAQKDVYESEPKTKVLKHSKTDWKVVADATDKHPAQVREVAIEQPMAVNTVKELRGNIPTEEKARLLMRCDELIQAAKQARQTANDASVDGSVRIGEALFNYLLNK